MADHRRGDQPQRRRGERIIVPQPVACQLDPCVSVCRMGYEYRETSTQAVPFDAITKKLWYTVSRKLRIATLGRVKVRSSNAPRWHRMRISRPHPETVAGYSSCSFPFCYEHRHGAGHLSYNTA